jgi:hypothetical protein
MQRGPHSAAFIELLSASLTGKLAGAADPAGVYDRGYRMDAGTTHLKIVGSLGDMYQIEHGVRTGYLDTETIDAKSVQLGGWAVDFDRQPAQTIAVFRGDRFLGYGASGMARPDVARRLGRSAQYAGFDFLFPNPGTDDAGEKYRLFVLSQDGRAAELRRGFPGASYVNAIRALWAKGVARRRRVS